jgi:hypothetical protein
MEADACPREEKSHLPGGAGTALVRGMNDSGPAAARLRDEERNRLEEVLANMAREGVIVARPTRSGAVQYVPGPHPSSWGRGWVKAYAPAFEDGDVTSVLAGRTWALGPGRRTAPRTGPAPVPSFSC